MTQNTEQQANSKLQSKIEEVSATRYFEGLTSGEKKELLSRIADSHVNGPVIGDAVAEGLSNMPLKKSIKFHLKGFAVHTIATIVGVSTVAYVGSKISNRAKSNAAGTDENPFATEGVEATPRPFRKTVN